jgi:hypothetical protein
MRCYKVPSFSRSCHQVLCFLIYCLLHRTHFLCAMAGETDQTLLSISDTAASIGKVASGAESDTAPTSSSSNFTAEKIVKKDVPMLFEYWRESTVTEADRAAYHAAGWLPGGVESSMSDLEFPMVDNTTIIYFESHLIPRLCNIPEV